MNLKPAASHRGTETTEAADKELYLRKALKNCYPLGEDKPPENRPPFHLLCALCDSVAISTAGFRIMKPHRLMMDLLACLFDHLRSQQAIIAGVLLASSAFAHTVSQGGKVEDLAARAERLEAQGKWNAAAAAYREILRLDPRSIPALNRLGALYVRQEKFREGIKYYQQALQLVPNDFGTNLNLGIAYIKSQNYVAAAVPLEKATRADPDNLQARQLLAV